MSTDEDVYDKWIKKLAFLASTLNLSIPSGQPVLLATRLRYKLDYISCSYKWF